MQLQKQTTWWTRESVSLDTEHYYIFGDNEEGWGKGGQACIRGLPNAFGIPTLKAPGVFWSDETYDSNVACIEAAIQRIPTNKPWIVSADGLGTGLAQLDVRAPKTFSYLTQRMEGFNL